MSEQHWYFLKSSEDAPDCFLAFVNAKDNCSARAYDAESGDAMHIDGRRVRYVERRPEDPPKRYAEEFRDTRRCRRDRIAARNAAPTHRR